MVGAVCAGSGDRSRVGRHRLAGATQHSAIRIEQAVDDAYRTGLKPMEFGGGDGTAAISKAVMTALG